MNKNKGAAFSKFAIMEEENKMKEEEEERKRAKEEAKAKEQAELKNTSKIQQNIKEQRMEEADKLRSELKSKIRSRITKLMLEEEQACRKPEEETKTEITFTIDGKTYTADQL